MCLATCPSSLVKQSSARDRWAKATSGLRSSASGSPRTARPLRTEPPHTSDGTKALCREIFCDYDLDGHMQWHSLHDNDVRECTTPSPADESGIADPFPTGTHIEVWWPGDNCWYVATVLKTRTAWHSQGWARTLGIPYLVWCQLHKLWTPYEP